MKLIYQIPRNSLAWLLIAFAAVVAPHISRLPIWVSAATLICFIWRIQVHRGLWAFPPRWFKLILAASSMAGLFVGYGSLTGLEPMVALLIIGTSFKLLEMYQRRDALIVIYLAYLIAATQLLFSQTIASGAYLFVMVLLVSTGLIGLNQSEGYKHPIRSLRLTTVLLLQALPLMLVLFAVMPRLGALWSVPLQKHTATTGVSDSMSPGDFTQLAKSGKLAFRVSFKDTVPEPSQRYWRGLVFSRFDGRTWKQADPFDYQRDGEVVRWQGDQPKSWESLIETQGKPINYSLVMEPTQQIWLYALATPVLQENGTGITRDFGLVSHRPVQKRTQFNLQSYLGYRTEVTLAPWRYQHETRLPSGYNPETLALARQWRRDASSDSAYIERVLNWFNQKFSYTLSPPALGKHSVDDFLLSTQSGFCEHFASSFTVMMRAAGIPARVVVGYQGGELNPYQNYLLVHQFDAHAWTEVWLKGRGWVRFDPTAAVAPERIENSLEQLLNQEEFLSDSPMALVRYRNIPWINTLRLQMDRINYAWHRWVLGYNTEIQTDFLRSLLGKVNPLRIALACLLCGGLVIAFVAFRLLVTTRKEPIDPVVKSYQRFCRKLGRLGFVRKKQETPNAFAERVIEKRPDLAEPVRSITVAFQNYLYHETTIDKAFHHWVTTFKPKKRRL